jgi:HK97 family phage portal protein
MAWNSRQDKSANSGLSQKAAPLGPGAPVSLHPATAGRAYRDSWDIERAYREGVQKVVWVQRCIDAIAGNQARLPMILRKDNNPHGQIVDKKNNILNILNTKANEGENSFVFRYRLSSQLLMSSRGVFIEKVFGRDGSIQALNLLPPQFTSPIPDPKHFVAGYEVDMPNGMKHVIPKEKVVWIRRPHPLDPYLSLTAMESAGIAIEIENLARVYNRNFLLNDGRPGGLLVIRGEMDDDDKDELRSRFRGNLSRTGSVSVIASDDGADFIDTGANPRDAAYIQMRQITKEEILAAFGVPESVIGNASGRTFSNAAEELRVFWMETMMPHLEPLARALDELDEQYYIDFDTTEVPILILSKQERERYLMEEQSKGLISVNEYREITGRKKVESEIADQLLMNPNLVPIANTEKPFDAEEQVPVAEAGAVPAPDGQMPMEGMEGVPPEGQDPMQTPQAAIEQAPEQMAIEPVPEGQLSLSVGSFQTKELRNQSLDSWDSKAFKATDLWTGIMEASLDRFFDRQQRVVTEKATGAKSRKLMRDGSVPLEVIFDKEVWNRQLSEDMKPLLKAIIFDARDIVALSAGFEVNFDLEEIDRYVDKQIERFEKVNNSTGEEIASAVLVASSLSGTEEEKSSMLRTGVSAIYSNLLGKRKRLIAEHETQTAFNAGTFFASEKSGSLNKTWLTRRDGSVRTAHQSLDGRTVPVGKGFSVDGNTLRFPGDPSAPLNLTMNCRCRLKFEK